MDQHSEIQKIATSFAEEIHDLEVQIVRKKKLLDAISNVCDHPRVEVYRDRKIGTCEFCRHEFMTREQVDAIFAE